MHSPSHQSKCFSVSKYIPSENTCNGCDRGVYNKQDKNKNVPKVCFMQPIRINQKELKLVNVSFNFKLINKNS